MPIYDFVTLDVFTDRRFGGNPLAVFPDARGLTDAEMQALAAEFNYSETTFVLLPDDPAHTARVRIFTPKTELPFAGHPTVGTGHVLAGTGRDRDGRMVFEVPAGAVEVVVARNAAGAIAETTIAAPLPLSVGETAPPEAVAACAGIAESDLRHSVHAPQFASTGNPFLFAEVAPEALTRAAPDVAAFRAAEARWPALRGRLALHLYAHDGEGVRARMFAPLAGVPEDPATGSANVTLAALLLSLRGGEALRLAVRQGEEMGRPSRLTAEARRAPDGIRATIGGGCVPVLRGQAMI